MAAMKVWILCFVLIAAFAVVAEGLLDDSQPKVSAVSSGGVTAGLINRQKRQFGYGGYPGGGGFGGSNSNAFANAQTSSFGGGSPFGGGFSGSSANAAAGSNSYNGGGFGRRK